MLVSWARSRLCGQVGVVNANGTHIYVVAGNQSGVRDRCSRWGHGLHDETGDALRLLNCNIFLDGNGHLRFGISPHASENLCFSRMALMEDGAQVVVLAERGLVGLEHGCAQGFLVCGALASLVAQAVFCDVALPFFVGLEVGMCLLAALDGGRAALHVLRTG